MQTPNDLRYNLQKFGIELEYKHKRTSSEIEGVSFRYGNISFKGSEVDRKYSFGNIKKVLEKNIEESKKRGEEELLREQMAQKVRQEAMLKVKQEDEENARKEDEAKAQVAKRNIIIKGVVLSDEQEKTLMGGGHIFLKNMTAKDGKTQFSAYAFLNDEKKQLLFSYDNPDEFVKYGKYEMRVRDKILIENGYITKAKVKWFGGVNYEYLYLWKVNKADAEYKESCSDTRLPKTQKEEQKPNPPIIQQKNRGRKR